MLTADSYLNKDATAFRYCPACGGNFEGNSGACDCKVGRVIQRMQKAQKQYRDALKAAQTALKNDLPASAKLVIDDGLKPVRAPR